MSRRRISPRSLAVLGGVFVMLCLSACAGGGSRGGGAWGDAVVRIGRHTISMRELMHWTAVEASINAGDKPPAPKSENMATIRGMLRLLLSYEWIHLEALAQKVSVTPAELDRLLYDEFGSKAKMEPILAARGESVSDARYIAESKVLVGALHHKEDPEHEIVPKLFAKWRPLTECRPGYVVGECSESARP
jgi:hypothetical protein